MEIEDSDTTLSDGSDLSLDIPMETKGGAMMNTFKDMSVSLRRSEVTFNLFIRLIRYYKTKLFS